VETEKIGFLKKVKIAIFNLEKYKVFVQEKFSQALKYLSLLIFIATICLSVSSTIQVGKGINKLTNYIKNDFPDFSLEDGKLNVEEIVNSYDKEYEAKLIVDTEQDISEEKIKEYKKEAEASVYSVVLLNDKIIYRLGDEFPQEYEASYNELTEILKIKNITKTELFEKYLNDNSMPKVYAIIWVYAFLSMFFLNILTLIEDIIIVTVFGWIASKISRVKLTLGNVGSLAIYSLTLSIILSTIYSIIFAFTGFEIKYFAVMYMLIAYIYMVASIMIMKEDINKMAGEAVTVEGQVIKTPLEDEEEIDNKKEKEPEAENKDKEEIPENEQNNGENDEELPNKDESKKINQEKKQEINIEDNIKDNQEKNEENNNGKE